MFKENQSLQDPDQINELKMVMYSTLDRVEQGVYPPFPSLLRI